MPADEAQEALVAIVARDAGWTNFDGAPCQADRRYLLGLLRECRTALSELADACDVWAEDEPSIRLIDRLAPLAATLPSHSEQENG